MHSTDDGSSRPKRVPSLTDFFFFSFFNSVVNEVIRVTLSKNSSIYIFEPEIPITPKNFETYTTTRIISRTKICKEIPYELKNKNRYVCNRFVKILILNYCPYIIN